MSSSPGCAFRSPSISFGSLALWSSDNATASYPPPPPSPSPCPCAPTPAAVAVAAAAPFALPPLAAGAGGVDRRLPSTARQSPALAT